jgi:hypothetical protein
LGFARERYRKRDVNLKDLVEVLTYPAFWRLAGGTGVRVPAKSSAR